MAFDWTSLIGPVLGGIAGSQSGSTRAAGARSWRSTGSSSRTSRADAAAVVAGSACVLQGAPEWGHVAGIARLADCPV